MYVRAMLIDWIGKTYVWPGLWWRQKYVNIGAKLITRSMFNGEGKKNCGNWRATKCPFYVRILYYKV